MNHSMDINALLVGGLLPAILLGASTFLMKLSMREGASIPTYLVLVGGTVLCVGLLGLIMVGNWSAGIRASASAIVMGLAWSIAIAAMAYAISVLKVPVAIIAPLTNSNALVALALSSIFFQEWQSLDMPRVLAGTLLIVVGATVVSTS